MRDLERVVMRTQPAVFKQRRDRAAERCVQRKPGSAAARIAGVQFMIDKLMRRGGPDKGGAHHEVSREAAARS